MPRQNAIATKDINLDEGTLTIKWADGTQFIVDEATLTPDMRLAATLHGLSQKLGDSYANVKGDLAQAKDNAEEVWSAIQAGDWNRKASGDGGIIAEAVAEVQGITKAEAAETLRKQDDATKRKIAKHPQVAKIVARIKLERAEKAAANAEDSSAVDLAELF